MSISVLIATAMERGGHFTHANSYAGKNQYISNLIQHNSTVL